MSIVSGEVVETLQRLRMSWEEYLGLPEKPKAEWVDGEVVVSPPVAPEHSDASFGMMVALKGALPGCKIYGDVGVHLPRNRVRAPDVMVLAARPNGARAEETPILVVEVLSPSTQSEDLLRKAPEYAEAGIGQYWIVDPEHRTLEVFELRDAAWEPLLSLDEAHPAGEVQVGEYGVVPLELADLLDG